MHDVLRERLLRRIESLPEAQVYQVLDFVEFLESKYAREAAAEASGLQRFAERMEDRLRRRAVSPATLREAFQLISAADRVLQNVSSAGRQIFGELGTEGEDEPPEGGRSAPRPAAGAGPGGGRREAPDRPPAGEDSPLDTSSPDGVP